MTHEDLGHRLLRRARAHTPDVERLAVLRPRAHAAHVVAEGAVPIAPEDVVRRICRALILLGRRAVPERAVLAVHAAAACKVQANVVCVGRVVGAREASVRFETHACRGARRLLVAALSHVLAVPDVELARVLHLL